MQESQNCNREVSLLICRLWSPGGAPVEEDVAKVTHDNQQRMQEGPQMLRGINPRVMQVRKLKMILVWILMNQLDRLGSTRASVALDFATLRRSTQR